MYWTDDNLGVFVEMENPLPALQSVAAEQPASVRKMILGTTLAERIAETRDEPPPEGFQNAYAARTSELMEDAAAGLVGRVNAASLEALAEKFRTASEVQASMSLLTSSHPTKLSKIIRDVWGVSTSDWRRGDRVEFLMVKRFGPAYSEFLGFPY